MSKDKAKRRRLPFIAAAVSAAVLLGIGSVTAYFTDVDIKDNVITIGKTGLELTEPNYPKETQTVVPGSVVTKDPTLTNTGTIPEYVFMKVKVPKENVTLLYESGDDIGKTKGLSGKQQIFKILTNEGGTASIDQPAGQDVQFNYHAPAGSQPGWYLVKAETKTDSGVEWDEYVFGYSKSLKKDESTNTLFDKVQLKSFIEREITAADPQTNTVTETITVNGMSIQTKNLDIGGVNNDGTTEAVDQTKLQAIYAIVERKAARS